MLFGIHVTVDGYGGSKEVLSDVEKALEVLLILARQSEQAEDNEMQVYGPHVNEDGAWGVFMVSPRIRMSVHSYPSQGHISIDMYPMSLNQANESIHSRLTQAFQLKNIEVNALQRGTRFKDTVMS